MPRETSPRKTPWYLITELIFFIIPIAVIGLTWKKMNRKALLISVLLVMVLGYLWSIMVSANGWWQFNHNTMLGFELLPHFPIEEALFYPLGGALSIMLYTVFKVKLEKFTIPPIFLYLNIVLVTIFLLVLTGISINTNHQPVYIVSQFVLYNGLCLLMWQWAGKKIHVLSMWTCVLLMTIIGFIWNWIGFTQNLWSYHATLGWMWPQGVPIDDWNFYLFAPMAAVSLYEFFNKTSE